MVLLNVIEDKFQEVQEKIDTKIIILDTMDETDTMDTTVETDTMDATDTMDTTVETGNMNTVIVVITFTLVEIVTGAEATTVIRWV
jgi:hypothetical protein